MHLARPRDIIKGERMKVRNSHSILILFFILFAASACSSQPEEFESVVFSPDGEYVAAGSSDSKVRVWNADTGELIFTLSGHSRSVSDVAFSPDGSILASGSVDETAVFWDVATGKKIHVFKPEHIIQGNMESLVIIYSVAFSPDGKWFAAGSDPSTIHIWDANSRELVKILDVSKSSANLLLDQSSPHGIEFSPDGSFLAAFTWGSTSGPYLWETKNFEMTPVGPVDEDSVEAFAISPDSKTIATSKDEGVGGINTIELWDILSGQMIKRWKATQYKTASRAITYSPDGKIIAYGDFEKMFTLRDANTGKVINLDVELPAKGTPPSNTDFIIPSSIAFSPDGTRVAVSANFSILGVWDVKSGRLLWQFVQ